jgi:hypothetical protein
MDVCMYVCVYKYIHISGSVCQTSCSSMPAKIKKKKCAPTALDGTRMRERENEREREREMTGGVMANRDSDHSTS